jgi:hypothetical protein
MAGEASGVYEVTPLGDRWAIRWGGVPLLVVNDVATAVDLVNGAQRALLRKPREEPASFAPLDGDDDDAPPPLV